MLNMLNGVLYHLRYRVYIPLLPLDKLLLTSIFDDSTVTTSLRGTWWIYKFQSNQQPPTVCTDLRLYH